MKLYLRLATDRKRTLDLKIDELRSRYLTNEGFDYNGLCGDQDIRYYEHIDIVQPVTLPRVIRGKDGYLLRDTDGRIVKHGKRDVYNFPFKLKSVRDYMKVHELAHILFNHDRETIGQETEANYVARQITGVKLPNLMVDIIGAIEVIGRNKKMVNYFKDNDELYFQFLRELAQKISPIYPK